LAELGFGKSFAAISKNSPVHQMATAESSSGVGTVVQKKVASILFWEDPLTTGLTFAVGLAGFFLMGVVRPRCKRSA